MRRCRRRRRRPDRAKLASSPMDLARLSEGRLLVLRWRPPAPLPMPHGLSTLQQQGQQQQKRRLRWRWHLGNWASVVVTARLLTPPEPEARIIIITRQLNSCCSSSRCALSASAPLLRRARTLLIAHERVNARRSLRQQRVRQRQRRQRWRRRRPAATQPRLLLLLSLELRHRRCRRWLLGY